MTIIYTMQLYKGIRLIENLKWGRIDREMTQSGSHYMKGTHGRYIKTDLRQLKKDFTKAIREYKQNHDNNKG